MSTTFATMSSLPAGRSRPQLTRLVVGYAAVLGTIPYLVLKAAWLSGSTIGITDKAKATDGSLFVLNTITAGMDLVAIVVALAFTHRWGQRVPAWLVLGPIWVGTGFLAPIALATPIVAAGSVLSTPDTAKTTSTIDFIEPWVQPLVYAGFAWQGVTLLTAFLLYARSRWPETFTTRTADLTRGATHPVQVVLANGAALLALAVGALHLVWAVGGTVGLNAKAVAERTTSTHLVDAVHGLMAIMAAAGVLMMVHRFGGRTRFWQPVTLAWVGAGAMFAWGGWSMVNVLGNTVLTGGDSMPLLNLQSFGKVIAGLVIGLTSLMLLAERRTTGHP